MKHFIIESSQEKKIDEIINIYINLLNENNNRSRNIFILVPNNMMKLKYEKKLNLKFSEELKIITYLNFIKKEIIKYWPIIVKDCKVINEKSIVPEFIPNSLSKYIINDTVNQKRNIEGYFNDITSTNRNISNSIESNISKASKSLLDYTIIGEKIYSSKKNKDGIMRFSYSQMNEIIDNYINTLLTNSLLDDSVCIYLYNNFLLNNKEYINYLRKDIRYLIVDSLENSSTAEVDFIRLVSEFTKETYIYFNKSRDYSVFNNVDMDYILEKIIDKNYRNTIRDIEIEDIYLLNRDIKLNETSQLYSDMIEESINKVSELVKSGVRPRDIAIISPVNNTILDYHIINGLKGRNIDVFNIKKDKKIIDYPYANALVVASCIFYGHIELIKEEEYINFIEILLNVNRIQALKIYKDKDNNNEYKDIIEYITSNRASDISMSEFLVKFYIDKMLNLKQGKENVKTCKQIINESESFIKNISRLKLDKIKDKEKIFIEALKTTINDYYSTSDIYELENSNSVLITSPYSYISYNITRPIQLWMDIGSNAWNMKIEKDINNVIVLRKSFEENRVYTDLEEDKFKKYYLYNMIYNLLLTSKEVYAYKSEYTVNGYIQESILYSLLLKIVDKAGEYNE